MKTPKPNTRLKRSRPKKRTHLPRMNNLELEALQARLMRESGISLEGKNAVMLSMRAAANPRAETAEMAIKTLEPEEQFLVTSAISGYQQIFGNVGMKGRMGLMTMTDEEWNALIDDD